MTSTVSLFLGILTLLAGALDIGVIVLVLLSRGAGVRWAGGSLGALADLFGPLAIALATIVAVTAMSGSLFYSQVAGFEPCELCWFQRIAMYSSAVILVVALVRRDRGVRPYVLTLASIGAAISTYHVAVQRIPEMLSAGCAADAPCSAIWVNTFGFVSIPVMAGVAFCSIIVALWLAPMRGREPDHVVATTD